MGRKRSGCGGGTQDARSFTDGRFEEKTRINPGGEGRPDPISTYSLVGNLGDVLSQVDLRVRAWHSLAVRTVSFDHWTWNNTNARTTSFGFPQRVSSVIAAVRQRMESQGSGLHI